MVTSKQNIALILVQY